MRRGSFCNCIYYERMRGKLDGLTNTTEFSPLWWPPLPWQMVSGRIPLE